MRLPNGRKSHRRKLKLSVNKKRRSALKPKRLRDKPRLSKRRLMKLLD